jgi:eukaryotic-like serine/threonine-protein kinase
MNHYRLFVSSPGDAMAERLIIEQAVSRLNGTYAGRARIETIRWETEFYTADRTFQAQIPDAASCDIVITIFRGRLGQPIPKDFAAMPDGEAYPSGTAYEMLTALEAAKHRQLPDVYVFRRALAPAPALNDPNRAAIEAEWHRLSGFFERWFVNPKDGFKAAFQGYDEPDDFARQIDHLLREWLARRVLAGRTVRWPVELLGSPFRGLASFGARHSSVFFGRARESEKSVALLIEAMRRGVGFLLVSGLSGSGKSSLARAGIQPRLTTPGVVGDVDLWRVASLRPGATPVATLAAKLFETKEAIPPDEEGRAHALPELADGDYKTPAELAELFQSPGPAAIRPVIAALDRVAAVERQKHGLTSGFHTKLAVVIDQLDDLFSTNITDAERQAFALLLDALARSGRAVVIATLRADLLAAFLAVEPLRALREAGAEITVAPPGLAELAEIVRAPAAAAGLTFEEKDGVRLDERLLNEVDKPDMLPLLQLALEKLFAARISQNDQLVLPFAAYGAGLASLIESEAEAAIAPFGADGREALKAMLRPLVERGKDGKLILSIASRDTVAPDGTRQRVLDALIDKRIMVSDQDGVRIAHQRVLTDWAKAKEAVASNQDFYRLRDDVSAAYRIYVAEGKRDDRLLGAGKPVTDALDLLKNFGYELPSQLKAYIKASHDKARRGERIKTGVIATLVVLSLAAGGGGFYALQQRNEAISAQNAAEQRRKEAQANFDLAKTTINSVIFDFAQGFKNIEGVRPEVLHSVLTRARTALDTLGDAVPDDRSLQRLRAAAFSELGDVAARGDPAGALALHTESEEIFRKLAKDEPGNTQFQRDLSISLNKIADIRLRGDPAAALALYEESLTIARKLAKDEPGNIQFQRDLSISLDRIADIRLRIDPAAALALYEESLAIARKLAKDEPGNTVFQRDLSISLNKIADIQRRSDPAAALALYEESLTIARKLAKDEPGNTEFQRDLSVSLDRIADIRLRTDPAAALPLYEESLAIRRTLAKDEPGNTVFQRDLSISLARIADIRLRTDPAAALALYEESLLIARKLAKDEPGNTQFQRDLSISLNKMADIRRRSDPAAALALYEESLAIRRKLAKNEPGNTEFQRDLSVGLNRIGDIRRRTDPAAALALSEESLSISRTLAKDESGNFEFKTDIVVSLYGIALATPDPDRKRASLTEALGILKDLDAKGQLSTDQKTWIGAIEAELK